MPFSHSERVTLGSTNILVSPLTLASWSFAGRRGPLSGTLKPHPDVLMIRYNAAHRGAESEVFDRLPDPQPGLIAYTATRWGELLQPRRDLGFESGMTAPECYRFVLTHPAVNTVLCGARTPDEVAQDVEGILAGPLSPERQAEVLRFGDAIHASPSRRSSRFMFDRRK